MILLPDPNTAYMDPFRARKTMVIHCYVADPVTGESYSRDPRYVARKAEEYMFSTGIADTAYFGPEPEFFILDDVRFDTNQHESYYHVDSVEGRWNSGRTAHGPSARAGTSSTWQRRPRLSWNAGCSNSLTPLASTYQE